MNAELPDPSVRFMQPHVVGELVWDEDLGEFFQVIGYGINRAEGDPVEAYIEAALRRGDG